MHGPNFSSGILSPSLTFPSLFTASHSPTNRSAATSQVRLTRSSNSSPSDFLTPTSLWSTQAPQSSFSVTLCRVTPRGMPSLIDQATGSEPRIMGSIPGWVLYVPRRGTENTDDETMPAPPRKTMSTDAALRAPTVSGLFVLPTMRRGKPWALERESRVGGRGELERDSCREYQEQRLADTADLSSMAMTGTNPCSHRRCATTRPYGCSSKHRRATRGRRGQGGGVSRRVDMGVHGRDDDDGGGFFFFFFLGGVLGLF
mmetsp:Transcript_20087/g.40222  ORF Transcript_20087/g.40222 Transcript_20087/m.40222 type:complete len:258 (-) Transcript_20087:101-874(-)